ncbi:MAG: DUF5686 and carboxypeptidase regulatory-like domain-containing protein [Bacteroides sp.]|nr:DUF5686 and carboxypeptidase regulatory-like domain-containing protein [Bacteroides sp.]
MLKVAGWGKTTDDKGRFSFNQISLPDTLVVSAMGYRKIYIPVSSARSKIDIRIPADGVQLGEVVVRPKKEKYSKKNNPAVDFVNKIRESEYMTDPRRNPYYNFDKYQRITIALNNISAESDKNLILKKFDFLRDNIDTSEVSGRPILNVSMREKLSTVHYRKDPESTKEYIEGVNQVGLDDFLDEQSMRTMYEDFFCEIDLYQNDIDLLHNKFVSPLSRIAPDFYRFYLTDTVKVGDVECIELSFVPRNSRTFGFTGRIYVDKGDSTMFIRKVSMGVPKDINLNFIDHIYITQEFEKAPDGSRLLKKDDLVAEISVMSGVQGLYFRRNSIYSSHNFQPATEMYIYDIPGISMMASGASYRDSTFWASNRMIELRHGEAKVGMMTHTLRKVPLYYWGEKFIKIFALGYVSTSAHDSKFDIGPVNTIISHNDVEGYRLRLGGMTTANLSKHLFLRGYGAYGFKDHKWKYSGEIEWSFNKKKYHSREYPIHSLRFTHRYDMDMLGQHYAFTNPDNMFLSFRRRDDLLMSYLRLTRFEYNLELLNGFSVTAALQSKRQEVSPFVHFIDGYDRSYNHFSQSGLELSLRFAPGEKIYQNRMQRVSLTPQYPVFVLTHVYEPKSFAGNMFEVNRTELSYSQRYWLSAFGYIDFIMKGVHIWSSVPYTNLAIPNANLSYTIQPESFAMLNPMEFMTDSYLMADLTYWANGAILNYIPLINKLKLREVFGIRGFWGHLSKRNRPDLNKSLFVFPESSEPIGSRPYMEASVGLDNIFRILRVDYVWRLTYRNKPDIDRGGVRIALHFTF